MSLRTNMMMTALAKNPLLEGIVAYWKLDGNSNDSVGGHNGTDTAVSYSVNNGKTGAGANFNGGRIVVSSSSDFSFSTSLSISLWMKSTDDRGDNKYLISRPISPINGTNGWDINTGNNESQLSINLNGLSNSPFSTDASIYDGLWHHIVVTLGSDTVELYIDNLLADSWATSGSVSGSNSNLCIGTFHGTYFSAYYYVGQLDEIGLWNRPLTIDEIGKLYNSGVGKQYPFNKSSINSLHNNLIAGCNFEGNANDILSMYNAMETGVIYNHPSGKINMGASFNGTASSHITINNFPAFQFDTSDFCVAMWIQRAGQSFNTEFFFAQCGPTGANTSISVILSIENDDTVNGSVCQGTSVVSARTTTVIDDTNWHHVILQREGNTLRVYLNGASSASVGLIGGINVVNEQIGIGCAGAYFNNSFNGSIDCLYVYNRALNASEIAYLYNSGNGRQYPFAS